MIKPQLTHLEEIDQSIERVQKALHHKIKSGQIFLEAQIDQQKAHNEWLSAMNELSSVSRDII